MDFSLTKDHQSATEPGVSFVLRRLGPKERAVLELRIAKERAELRELETAREEYREKLKNLVAATGVDKEGKPAVADQPTLITAEMLGVSADLGLASLKAESFERANIATPFIEASLVSVKNEGQNVPLDQFYLGTSERLFTEIYELIVNGVYIDPESAKNSQPSTTTNAVDGGETKTSSADPAANALNTSAATASSTSHSA